MFTSLPGSTWTLQIVAVALITNIKDPPARSARSGNVSDARVSRLDWCHGWVRRCYSFIFIFFVNIQMARDLIATLLHKRLPVRAWIIANSCSMNHNFSCHRDGGGLHIPPTPHRQVMHLSSSGPFFFGPADENSDMFGHFKAVCKQLGWRFSVGSALPASDKFVWIFFNNDILK